MVQIGTNSKVWLAVGESAYLLSINQLEFYMMLISQTSETAKTNKDTFLEIGCE